MKTYWLVSFFEGFGPSDFRVATWIGPLTPMQWFAETVAAGRVCSPLYVQQLTEDEYTSLWRAKGEPEPFRKKETPA
jgi:hypothetical protein